MNHCLWWVSRSKLKWTDICTVWEILEHRATQHSRSPSVIKTPNKGIWHWFLYCSSAVCNLLNLWPGSCLAQPAKSHRSAYKFCTQVIRQSFPLTSVEGRCVQITYIKTMSGDIVLRLWKPRYRVEWDRQILDFNQGDGCYVQCENKSQYWVFLTLIPRM